MDNISNSCDKSNAISSEDNVTNVSTPNDFFHQDPRENCLEPKYIPSSNKINSTFMEKLQSARQHLQRIEKKKELIEKNQVL